MLHPSGDFYRVSNIVSEALSVFNIRIGFHSPSSKFPDFSAKVIDLFSELSRNMSCIRLYNSISNNDPRDLLPGVSVDHAYSVFELAYSCCQQVYFQMKIQESRKPEDAFQHPPHGVVPERVYHLAKILYARAYANPTDPNLNPAGDEQKSEKMIVDELKEHGFDDLTVRQVQWGISLVQSQIRDMGEKGVMDAIINGLREKYGIHSVLSQT
jgi:hypothetical protein